MPYIRYEDFESEVIYNAYYSKSQFKFLSNIVYFDTDKAGTSRPKLLEGVDKEESFAKISEELRENWDGLYGDERSDWINVLFKLFGEDDFSNFIQVFMLEWILLVKSIYNPGRISSHSLLVKILEIPKIAEKIEILGMIKK